MQAYLVVVADAARARLFGRQKKYSALEEIETLTHPESRLRRQDLVSDRAGTVHEARAYGESAADQQTDPKQREAVEFARHIAGRVRHLGNDNGKPEGITLVAGPQFLGLLRQQLDKETRNQIIAEIPANLTREDAAAIAQRIDQK